MKALLLKVKWNKGQTENGTQYDYCRVTLQLPVFEGATNEFGVDSAEYEYGNAESHIKLLHLKGKLPIEVDVDFQQVKKGNQTLNQIISLKPLSSKPI
ncbi:hypothetical protein [Snodgrassella gandavensis]|uniref:hypothetical protein n=1 Tax=Snodgrassella gandavensis TaxID=2946698 RepID=UPI001EF57023|nr:hypothetical protein [Snodgrassella gandavensis]